MLHRLQQQEPCTGGCWLSKLYVMHTHWAPAPTFSCLATAFSITSALHCTGTPVPKHHGLHHAMLSHPTPWGRGMQQKPEKRRRTLSLQCCCSWSNKGICCWVGTLGHVNPLQATYGTWASRWIALYYICDVVLCVTIWSSPILPSFPMLSVSDPFLVSTTIASQHSYHCSYPHTNPRTAEASRECSLYLTLM